MNIDVNGFEVDFAWPGLCVEIDGAGHGRPRTKADDRIRDAALRAARLHRPALQRGRRSTADPRRS